MKPSPTLRRALCLALLAAAAAGCTQVTQLRNAKTGQTAHCGGEMWTPFASGHDEHCLKYFHQQGFDPVP